MSLVRSALVSVAIVGIVMSVQVMAQAPTAEPPAKEPPSKIRATADEVAKWTTKEWNKAKTQWVKEKEKWAGCQKQSKDQGLTGRKSWSFLASCMTSST